MILLDGHNRFEISAKHGGIPFEVKKLHFTDHDREQAVVWICKNQLGRRNLPLPDKVLLEDRKRKAYSVIAKEKKLSTLKQNTESEDKISCPRTNQTRQSKRENSTDYKIAKAAGTSEDTVRKVREINEKAPETIQQIRSGNKSINQAWLEIKERERKQEDFSAKAHLEKAEERHADFQSAKTVTLNDVVQDKKDSAEIASNKADEIYNAIKRILFIGAQVSGGDNSFSIINKKTMDENRISRLKGELDNAISVLTMIRDSIGEKN